MQPTLEQDFTGSGEVLAVSLELSKKSWKVALHEGCRARPALHTAGQEGASDRLGEVVRLIEETRCKWRLGQAVRVVVIYEAGQDGFWIWRALSALGYEVVVVDPASILVERHARRAKTDRLDAIRLVTSLLGWLRGERDRLQVIRVPSEEAEALRQWVRERGQLQKEIGQHRDRMRKLLRTVGCWDEVQGDLAGRLERGQLLCHDGRALPEPLRERLAHECQRLALAEEQLKGVEATLVKQLPAPVQQRVERLSQLKGVGPRWGRCGGCWNCSGATSTTGARSAPVWGWCRNRTTAARAGSIRASASRATGGCARC